MRRIVSLFILVVALLAIFATAANAVPAHWTDGTTYQGQVNYGPPPAPQSDDTCNIWKLDPPNPYVWITVHAFENGVEYGSDVFEYISGQGWFPADVHDLVTGHDGEAYLTWNIGTGHSETFPFHCVTSTTSSTESSTTSSTTSTTISTASTSFMSSSSTTTPSASGSTLGSTSKPVSLSHISSELPMTGSTPWGMVGVAISMLVSGIILIWKTGRI